MSRRQKTGGWGRCRRAENKQGKTIAKKEERGVGGEKVERDKTKRRRGSGRVIMKRRGVVRRKKNPINNPVQELWRCCPAEKCQNIRCTLPFSPYSLCPVEFFPRDNQLHPYQPFRTIIPSDLTHLFSAPSYLPRVLLVTGVGKPFLDERQLTYIPPFLTAEEITRLVSVPLVFLPLFTERIPRHEQLAVSTARMPDTGRRNTAVFPFRAPEFFGKTLFDQHKGQRGVVRSISFFRTFLRAGTFSHGSN